MTRPERCLTRALLAAEDDLRRAQRAVERAPTPERQHRASERLRAARKAKAEVCAELGRRFES